ncbi:MAG: HAD family hydrolase [Candidatus Aerophobetes bacterium]|nr:HAD family hydrolase [Candidatus Aerophobetes bacterium]
MIKACAFDVGNTLINDRRLVKEALFDLATWLKENHIIDSERTFIETYRAINRETSGPFLSHTFGEPIFFEETLKRLRIADISVKEVLERYREFLMRRIKPDDDVIQAFEFLRDKGIKVALISNERVVRVKLFIENTGLSDLLDVVVVSEEVRISKPDPAIFVKASRRLGVECPEMVMFGDDERADGGGKKLGMKFVLVTAYKHPEWQWDDGPIVKPDFVIERVRKTEIKRCLEKFPLESRFTFNFLILQELTKFKNDVL